MKLTSSITALVVSSLMLVAPVVQAGGDERGATKGEAVGVGAGALIGGAVGGPVGVILGAALGGHYGHTHDRSVSAEQNAERTQAALDRSARKLSRALNEQASLDRELLQAEQDLEALNQRINRLFIERALVDGLRFDVHFDTDDATLGDTDRERLVRLSQLLNALPDAEVELHGFADARGNADYNELLSLDRAYNVADTLHALGVSETQIKTFAQGESQATYTGDDVEAYSHDRKVSIQLQLPADVEAVAQQDAEPDHSDRRADAGQ